MASAASGRAPPACAVGKREQYEQFIRSRWFKVLCAGGARVGLALAVVSVVSVVGSAAARDEAATVPVADGASICGERGAPRGNSRRNR